MATLFEQAKKRYNDLMFDICREYNTIGTSFTEDAENRNQWNLRDLVSEVQYTLEVYKSPDSIYYEDAHDPTQGSGSPWYKEWKSEIGRMQRFVNRFKDEALKIDRPYENHCSKFD